MVASNTKAQDAVIKLPSQSLSVGNLISEIEKQTDYLVVYSNREINTERQINVKNTSAQVMTLLKEAFAKTEIGYEFENESLLRQALTHSSYANEKHMKKLSDNERCTMPMGRGR